MPIERTPLELAKRYVSEPIRATEPPRIRDGRIIAAALIERSEEVEIDAMSGSRSTSDVEDFKCPGCTRAFSVPVGFHDYAYCPNCGRPIQWK